MHRSGGDSKQSDVLGQIFIVELRTMLRIPVDLRFVANRDGALILDTPQNAMTPLNSTGAYVWQRLERGMALDDIVTELANETNTDRERVAEDVGRFLENLKSRRLLAGA